MTDDKITLDNNTMDQTRVVNPDSWVETSLVQLPRHELESYYRSKAYTPLQSINPLVAAASPLLDLTYKLQNTDLPPDPNRFYTHLIHEVKAFEQHANERQYAPEVVLIARYVLCSTLDDAIESMAWYESITWQENRLLVHFHEEVANDHERFFIILERMSENPDLHVDLLELMYLSLSAGYTGQYRFEKDGQKILEHIIDTLYHKIQGIRGDVTRTLSVNKPVVMPPLAEEKSLPWWKVVAVTGFMITVIYWGFEYLLGLSSENLLRYLHHLSF